jgi:hypothetical protein
MAKSTGIERSKKNPIELEHNNTLLQNKKPWRAVQITTNNDKLTTT